MSRSRVVVLVIASVLSALVANSTTALIVGLRPAIFDGPVLVVLIAATVICWITYGFAVRADRSDRRERVRNFATAAHFVDGDTMDSGSWRRPAMD